jgi:ribosomal protein L11 methyltransferase
MYSLFLECSRGEKDRLIAELAELGTTGVIEQSLPGYCRLQAFFDQPVPDGIFAAYGPRWQHEESRDWTAAAQSVWEPLLVGSRFFLAPPWCADPTPDGRLRLEIQPGMASGTGYHAPTQLCLEAMEAHLKPVDRLLDLGTGSGILAAAASRIIACDLDEAAARIAAGQFQDSGVPALLFTGSVRSLRSGVVDLIVANLSTEAILTAAPEIARVLARPGRLILSGVRTRRAAELRNIFDTRSFRVLETHEREGWTCLVLEAPAQSPWPSAG